VPQASLLLNAGDHLRFHQAVAQLLAEDPHFFFIADFPISMNAEQAKQWAAQCYSPDMAVYHPWLLRGNQPLAPASVVAACFQRNDEIFGVQQLPSNQPIPGGFQCLSRQTPAEMEDLLRHRINTSHVFADGAPLRLWGGATLSDRSDPDARFISTRRMMLAIQESIHRLVEPYVLEPVHSGLEKTIDVALQSAFQPVRKRFDLDVADPFESQVFLRNLGGQEGIEIQVRCRIPYVLHEMKFSLGVAG
jgi:phage tail sheath protein FI